MAGMRKGMIATGWSIAALAAGLCVLVGCAANSKPEPETATSSAAPAAIASPPAAAVTVSLVSHTELLERIAAHRGKLVVLDCWSTSCPPCVKEFPGLVRMARDYGDQVACLSLSFDYEGFGTPDEVLPPVQEFLNQVEAGAIENLLGREDSDTLYEKLELTSVPAIYVYGRDGRLLRRFDDDYAARELDRPFTYADVRQLVDETLGSGPVTTGPEQEGS